MASAVDCMSAQVASLRALHLEAFFLTASTSKEENERVSRLLKELGELKPGHSIRKTQSDELQPLPKQRSDTGHSALFLYVTPERIAKSKRLMSQLERVHAAGALALLVVDEAHCASQVRSGSRAGRGVAWPFLDVAGACPFFVFPVALVPGAVGSAYGEGQNGSASEGLSYP